MKKIIIVVYIVAAFLSNQMSFAQNSQNFETYERFYIRPHRGHLYPDALQYVGCNNGIDSWQLYNGPGANALIDIPSNKWNHLKILVSGSQAKVYWNESQNPVLEIDFLEHGISKGLLALNCPLDGSAYFSNFQYTLDNTIVFEKPEEKLSVIGTINDWKISQPFPVSHVNFKKTPDKQNINEITWQNVTSDLKGLVDISKYYPRKNLIGDCVFAKTILTAEKDKRIELGFGYSDYITIFLNGEPAFFGNSAYQSRDQSFLGIVGYYDNVFLQLKKGPNELMIIIGESSGGWAFMFRDNDSIFMEQGLKELWSIENMIQVPESVVYDTERDVCYVSSYFNGGMECIAKIKLNGEIISTEWIKGVSRPSGMAIYKNTLYCVDRTSLYEIDIDGSKIINKILIPDAKFPNDIAVDDNGDVYISDSNADAIYIYSNGKFEVLFKGEEIKNPNGLLLDNEKLIIGASGTGWLKSIDLVSKEIKSISKIGRGAIIDGIKSDGKSNYLVSDNNGRLFRISKKGKKTEILNTTTPGYNLADFEYIIDEKLLIIPGWLSNRISAFKFD